MGEKFDLQKMLREIRDDDAIDSGEATHLSQAQIQELVTRRVVGDTKQDTIPGETS